jgi:phosphatidate phosphatase APP1
MLNSATAALHDSDLPGLKAWLEAMTNEHPSDPFAYIDRLKNQSPAPLKMTSAFSSEAVFS